MEERNRTGEQSSDEDTDHADSTNGQPQIGRDDGRRDRTGAAYRHPAHVRPCSERGLSHYPGTGMSAGRGTFVLVKV